MVCTDNIDVDFLSALPGYDPTYVPIYHGQWSSYEENGWVYLLEREGRYYLLRGGYSVMAETHPDPVFDVEEISFEEAVAEMTSMEEAIVEINRSME